ncbi:MAG: SpoVR family protein [Alphaproteobacteria bacterium]|nr:SpoVR family protein [Alphaproteobacteria bacterium]
MTAVLDRSKLLFETPEWDFSMLDRVYEACEDIALKDLKLDVYPNQIEIIASEQMLDAYSSHGLPLMYSHWSFGKHFARDEVMYRKGYQGLAYEIVINSSPCISYLMEENTAMMQTLVIAHAAFGHNHFFKNNYLFRQWTDAESILEYLAFAKAYLTRCEERYGYDAVEVTLDAAHALMDQGVFRYRRPPRPTRAQMDEKRRKRVAYDEESVNEIWRTLPGGGAKRAAIEEDDDAFVKAQLKLPEENILYFLEKHAPGLRPWQREVLRIVRTLAQYFYPQRQTKNMNEGCATFVHHHIMNALYDKGQINEGAMLEFMTSHTAVVFQPGYDDRRYYGMNPYALGFNMMSDIRRMSSEPTEEDRIWFPEIAGKGDWRDVLKDAWTNYRDESFIMQYLSPKVMRDMRLFALKDHESAEAYTVAGIHDESGYRKVRAALAAQYDLSAREPDLQVTAANLQGDRKLTLTQFVRSGVKLSASGQDDVMRHVRHLWGYDVELKEVTA